MTGLTGRSGEPLPKLPLLHGPTPLHELPRLREALGGSESCPRILIKRDDLAGPALGGNKARKLEYVVGEALAQGATHLVTVGALQSNHARMTAAAARLAGLGCVLVLISPSPDPEPEGNLLLDHLFGASVHLVPPSDEPENPHEAEAIDRAVRRIREQGGQPYLIPIGASSPTGTLGYVEAVREIQTQLGAMRVSVDRLFYAAGSRGTQAGLLLGKRVCGASWTPRGVAVSPGEAVKSRRAAALVRDAAALVGAEGAVPPEELATDQGYIGEGYAIPTPGGMEAVRLLARTEAVLLDPVYTGKAMAGMIDAIRRADVGAEETVLFLHTGGAPSLFRRGVLPAILDERGSR